MRPMLKLPRQIAPRTGMQTHESFDRRHESSTSSDRSFGLVFAIFCSIVGGYRTWNGRAGAAWWLAAAVAFALLAFFWTAPLAPLNRLWTRLGQLLQAIVNPLVMGVVFVAAIAPTGLALRLLGMDLLRLRRDPSAPTYWIDRDPADARPAPMKDQF